MSAGVLKRALSTTVSVLLLAAGPLLAIEEPAGEKAFLSWGEKQAVAIARATRESGRVGGFFDTRITGTNRSYNYKLRATWLTPDVIRASARLAQLELGLTDEETLALVSEAEALGDTVILVEIDPREGSGVIPREWVAVLRPRSDDDERSGEEAPSARGRLRSDGRRMKALAGGYERDYAYDVFWLSFPLVDTAGEPLFPTAVDEAELVVRIAGKEGRVSWKIPSSLSR